jgi:hypothetical protein
MVATIARAVHTQLTVLVDDLRRGMKVPLDLALGTLDLDAGALDRHGHTVRYFDNPLADTRHSSLSADSVDHRDELATDARRTGLAIS